MERRSASQLTTRSVVPHYTPLEWRGRSAVEIFHRSSHFRRGPVDRHHARRRRGDAPTPHCPVSRDLPAHDPGLVCLPGGQCGGRCRDRRPSDRATGYRSGEHAVHVVAVHQRRHVRFNGDFQAGHGPGYGPGARAEPCCDGHPGAAGPGQANRRDDGEEVAQHPAGRQLVLAREKLRPALPEQRRHDSDQGRAGLAGGDRQRGPARPAGLQHASVARPAEADLARFDRGRRGQRPAGAERSGCGRPDRAGTGSGRPGFSIRALGAGPAPRGTGIR